MEMISALSKCDGRDGVMVHDRAHQAHWNFSNGQASTFKQKSVKRLGLLLLLAGLDGRPALTACSLQLKPIGPFVDGYRTKGQKVSCEGSNMSDKRWSSVSQRSQICLCA